MLPAHESDFSDFSIEVESSNQSGTIQNPKWPEDKSKPLITQVTLYEDTCLSYNFVVNSAMEKLHFIIFVSTLLLIPQIVLAQKQKVDLIISGGTVVTMDVQKRIIENGAIAVLQDKIVAVGTAGEIAQKYSSKNKLLIIAL